MGILQRIYVVAVILATVLLVVWAAGMPLVFVYAVFGFGGWQSYWFWSGLLIFPVAAGLWVSLMFVRFPGDH